MTNLVPITLQEERQFREQGYLLLRGVLDRTAVSTLLEEIDRLVAAAQSRDATFHEPYYHECSYKLLRALRLSRRFDALIDHPDWLGRLVSLMGPYIQLMGAEIFVRGAAEGAITGFHTDLGPGLRQMLPTATGPYWQIKAQVFLTDLSEPDSSNFMLIPGSHLLAAGATGPLCLIDALNAPMMAAGQPPAEAVQVRCAPGDVLLFPHSLWHGVAPNRSGRTRYSLSLRYGQLALRPLERFDPVLVDPNARLTARQRRLLGDLGQESPSPYRPVSQEAILMGI
jgi:hypothetical protein